MRKLRSSLCAARGAHRRGAQTRGALRRCAHDTCMAAKQRLLHAAHHMRCPFHQQCAHMGLLAGRRLQYYMRSIPALGSPEVPSQAVCMRDKRQTVLRAPPSCASGLKPVPNIVLLRCGVAKRCFLRPGPPCVPRRARRCADMQHAWSAVGHTALVPPCATSLTTVFAHDIRNISPCPPQARYRTRKRREIHRTH